jgi:hypothetical protein
LLGAGASASEIRLLGRGSNTSHRRQSLLIMQKTSGRIKAGKCRSALSRRGFGSVCYFFFTGSQTYSPLSSSPVNRPSRLVLLIARSSRVWAPTIPKRHQNGSNCHLQGCSAGTQSLKRTGRSSFASLGFGSEVSATKSKQPLMRILSQAAPPTIGPSKPPSILQHFKFPPRSDAEFGLGV